ncbi:MAG TPA: tetratricopeptide repeat protein, partial [Sphingopyxis sp.]|nr:tetratricopeptide repeat protein [Sphingopyxis sp.]
MNADDQQQALMRLRSYLEADPDNVPLLRDCAEAALAAADVAFADECYERLAGLGDLSESDASAAAVAAMRSGRNGRAVALLEPLVARHPGDAALRFNLAWSLALDHQPDRAADLLDDATTGALPQAAMLELQLRHERGDFDGAVERVAPYLAAHADYAPLQAAVSVLAMDVDDEDLARRAAVAGGDHPDALTTLGTLTLGDGDAAAAREMLERALTLNARSPRAWMGLGLANLGLGATSEALAQIDRGAEMFGDHLGSWIAAGWAHLISGDVGTAEARFLTAMALDDNFAECHGSLATIQALKGEREAAERSTLVALRLD